MVQVSVDTKRNWREAIMAGDVSLTDFLRLTSCLPKSAWRLQAAVLPCDRGAGP